MSVYQRQIVNLDTFNGLTLRSKRQHYTPVEMEDKSDLLQLID